MANRRGLYLGLGAVLLSVVTASCGLWSKGPTVSVRIDPRHIGTRAPLSRTEYSCYLVNVYGPGIAPTVGEQAIGYYAPECLQLGVSSRMVSGTALASEGVRFSLAAGGRRTIQVLGVVTSLGGACENSEISRLFEKDGKPELYQLASRQVDMFTDTRVDFRAADVIASPENLLLKCPSTKTEYDPANLKGVRIVTYNFDGGETLQNFSLAADGTTTLFQNVNLPFSPNQALATRDGSRSVYWDISSGAAEQYLMAQPGTLVKGGPVSTGVLEFSGKTRAAFSEDGQMLFLSTGTNTVQQMIYSGPLENYTFPNIGGFGDISAMWVWGRDLHFMAQNDDDLGSKRATFTPGSPAFDVTAAPTNSGLSFSDTDFAAVAVRGNQGIYGVIREDSSAGYWLRYYPRSGQTLAPVGAFYQLNTESNYLTTRMALDPTGRFLFVKHDVSGTPTLKSFLLNPDGTIERQSSLNLPANDFRAFAVDHRGKFLVMGSGAGTIVLVACPIAEDGNLSACLPFSGTIADNLIGIQSFPIF